MTVFSCPCDGGSLKVSPVASQNNLVEVQRPIRDATASVAGIAATVTAMATVAGAVVIVTATSAVTDVTPISTAIADIASVVPAIAIATVSGSRLRPSRSA